MTVLAVAGLGLAGACGGDDDEEPLAVTEPGSQIEVDAGERFTVVLESNASTGYTWALEVDPPREVVRFVDDRYVDPATDLVGASGRQELTFEAVGDGTTVLRLWYVRSFDDPPDPADRAEFAVIVGDGGPMITSGTTAPDGEGAFSVAELLATAPVGEVTVTGLLFDDGGGLVLCGVLAESYPPQCVGERVPIADPDAPISDATGTDITDADFTLAEGVRWTDRPVTLHALLVEGTLVVV